MPAYEIKLAGAADRPRWDAYVRGHPNASLYHGFGWTEAIHRAYGHAVYRFMLTIREGAGADAPARVAGVLPIVHLRHALFGNRLVSMPFSDAGGILADSVQAETRLLEEAIALGKTTGARSLEFRQERLLQSFSDAAERRTPPVATRSHKARMLLTLPASAAQVMPSFKSKLRSQVNKALKEGFGTRTGGLELVDDFYSVFAVNMRDLGSPVHSEALMREVLSAFPDHARILAVYRSAEPVAAALVVGFGDTLRNPWASSLRRYASLGPNMLLYLRMLEHACDQGYRTFDFGRSTPGEGSYSFKQQWGAAPAPLYWHRILLDGKEPAADTGEADGYGFAAQCWRRLPVALTRLVGPRIRKHISL
jgi:FemAB-related protein (PEP-CTERM system-associated)